MNDQPPTREPVTDSPWFWLLLFLCGALIALMLTGPKFSWRQPQIERQYQAREIAGQTVAAAEKDRPLSTPGHPMLSLRPLTLALAAALVVSTILFWMTRFRRQPDTNV